MNNVNRHSPIRKRKGQTDAPATLRIRVCQKSLGRVEKAGFLGVWGEWVVVILRRDHQVSSQKQMAATNRFRFWAVALM